MLLLVLQQLFESLLPPHRRCTQHKVEANRDKFLQAFLADVRSLLVPRESILVELPLHLDPATEFVRFGLRYVAMPVCLLVCHQLFEPTIPSFFEVVTPDVPDEAQTVENIDPVLVQISRMCSSIV